MKKHETQVLIAGAGPVGLATALAFTLKGVAVEIIDPRERASTHDYACMLQAPTLQKLTKLGLEGVVARLGLELPTAAVQVNDKTTTHEFGSSAPTILGQMALEAALEAALFKAGVKVKRGFRLARFEQSPSGSVCEVDELEACLMGYAVAHTEKLVRRKHTFNTRLLIGADGRDSLVRTQSSIDFNSYAPTALYRVAELLISEPLGPVLHISRQGQATHGVFPLSDKRIRVCIDLEDGPEGSYPKEKPVSWIDTETCQCVLEEFQYWLTVKFPGLISHCKELEWCRMIRFDHKIAAKFSANKIVLVGDAAYIDSPIGAPGLNSGIRIGCEIAEQLSPDASAKEIQELMAGFHHKLARQAQLSSDLRTAGQPTAKQLMDALL